VDVSISEARVRVNDWSMSSEDCAVFRRSTTRKIASKTWNAPRDGRSRQARHNKVLERRVPSQRLAKHVDVLDMDATFRHD